MAVTLYELLSFEERERIADRKYITVDISKEFRLLTVQDLHDIALIIISSEQGDIKTTGPITLHISALARLHQRAVLMQVSVF